VLSDQQQTDAELEKIDSPQNNTVAEQNGKFTAHRR
jgi:hypothetical protein